jgi:hypothetical protein
MSDNILKHHPRSYRVRTLIAAGAAVAVMAVGLPAHALNPSKNPVVSRKTRSATGGRKAPRPILGEFKKPGKRKKK